MLVTRWIALLRGVNVNGITVKSAELGALFRELGFDEVKTVLATGNVLFRSDDDAVELKPRIERALGDRFGYDAWIVLLPHDRLAGIVDAYPFPEDAETHAYVVFGSGPEAFSDFSPDLVPDGPDRVAEGDGVVYWACPKGSSTDTPFAKLAAKARNRTTTTTRNLNTVRKLLV
ncbi:pyridoxamine 5'-phosphate oxidase [Herbiconiux sp. L3-i23]|nr:pyridoxamine 5'-phosphate oxidase [Herbiconiux sp. L3-i23]